MKDNSIYLLLLLLLFLLPDGKATNAAVEDFSTYIGYAAVLSNDIPTDVKPEVIPTPLCGCNGTRQVISPDGLKMIKCPCGDNCVCKGEKQVTGCQCGCGKAECNCAKGKAMRGVSASANEKPKYYTYFFTAEWCAPCRNFKDNDVPKLKKNDWKFSDTCWEDGVNVVIVDIDKNQAMKNKYSVTSIPSFVVVRDDVELDRLVGYVDHITMGNFHNDTINNDKKKRQ